MNNSDLNTDKELFLRIAEGDEAAFTEVFMRYSNILYWHAFKLLNSEFWAEETVQDTFLQVWAGRNQLKEVGSPAAYLHRIAANRAFDRIRRQGLEVKMQYLVHQLLHPPENTAPEEKDEKFRMERLLEKAVLSLPVQRRLVFQLKYQQNFSYDEIAGQLNITKHTVRNQMTIALKNIRSYLMEKNDILLLTLVYYIFF